MKRKRTEITIEVEEVIQATGRSHLLSRAWCRECGTRVTMVTPQQGSAMTGISVRAINRRVECGTVHFMETSAGLLLLCANSLSVVPNDPP